MVIHEIIQILGSTIWAVLKAFLSLLPAFNQINGLQDQIIATLIGVPVFVVSLFTTGVGITKLVIKFLS